MVKDGANKKYYVDSTNYSNITSNNADLFTLCSFFVFQQLLLSARWYRDKLKVILKCWDIKILKEDIFIHPIGGECRNWHMRFGMALKCNVSHERESVQILLAIYIIEQSNAFIYPTTS
jgi:hypothetical protein